jgi:hypothetical protein
VTAAPVPSPWAKRLGYSGLVPFVALALGAWITDPAHRALLCFALLCYGSTILSFLGAIHWGLALRDPANPSSALLIWGVVPSLVAWVALLVGGAAGLCLIGAGLWACFAVDRRVYPQFQIRGWLGMRLALTAVASLSCLAAAIRSV